MNLGLYFHTIKHLKPVQFFGRASRFLIPAVSQVAPAPSRRGTVEPWRVVVERAPRIVGHDRCRFLNQEHDVGSASVWNDKQRDLLWLYNLHYFDDLNASDAVSRLPIHRRLMSRWVVENPAGLGVGWQPYPLSLRIVNWIKWALSGYELDVPSFQSLAVQVRFLRPRLEYHLLGNHLFENAKALIFAGAFFDSPEAKRWLAKGRTLLARELTEQVLSDGGHFERSPMYHALVLEGILDLIQLQRIFPSVFQSESYTALIETAERMLNWLRVMTHPDGDIALFNDTAFGIAGSLTDLERYASMLDLRVPSSYAKTVVDCQASGYVRLTMGDAVLIVDVGEIGPDYLPGHAHADTLSFELSVGGRRVIVNSGTSCYGIGRERLRQRSTSAHNTVEVDEQSSSEVWGSFRVARRARPFGLQVFDNGDHIVVRCSHDGYARLPGKVCHEREWCLSLGRLVIKDRVRGPFRRATGRFYVHPGVRISSTEQRGLLIFQDGREMSWELRGAIPNVTASSYHPEFGRVIDNQCLQVEFQGNSAEICFCW